MWVVIAIVEVIFSWYRRPAKHAIGATDKSYYVRTRPFVHAVINGDRSPYHNYTEWVKKHANEYRSVRAA